MKGLSSPDMQLNPVFVLHICSVLMDLINSKSRSGNHHPSLVLHKLKNSIEVWPAKGCAFSLLLIWHIKNIGEERKVFIINTSMLTLHIYLTSAVWLPLGNFVADKARIWHHVTVNSQPSMSFTVLWFLKINTWFHL